MPDNIPPAPKGRAKPNVTIAHSSDLHLGSDVGEVSSEGSKSLAKLRQVLTVAKAEGAALLIFAGDTFDHNRQTAEFVDEAFGIMDGFDAPVVILPGNHDPLSAESVYHRARLTSFPNVSVLGLTIQDAALFPKLGVEVWGKAHMDYNDMSPLSRPNPRSTPWQVVAAHGHFVEEPHVEGRFLGSWVFRNEDLKATGADYIALGHWNRAIQVGEPHVNAYYSGSPEYARSVNVVQFRDDGVVEVKRTALPGAAPGSDDGGGIT
ncbi:MAG: hypothetical protein GTO40_22520 [Deltaproteobacteria bacterium]|nr:hypothetical protein [Deltaproteobacteria bacterium]